MASAAPAATQAGRTYEQYRNYLIVRGVTLPAVVVFLVTALYATSEALYAPQRFWPGRWAYLAETLTPFVACWLCRGRLRQHAQLVLLGADLTYTVGVLVQALQPTTAIAGAALAIAIKVMATAVFFPWQPRLQYISASVTIVAYWTVLYLGGRIGGADSALFQTLGPCIAAVLSAAGAAGIDRNRRAMFEARAWLQLATDSAKVVLWTCDPRTLTIRFSSGRKRVLGRDESEITLAAQWDLVHPDDRTEAIATLQAHLQERTSLYENERRMLHADGSYRWVLIRSTTAYDIEGRPCGQYGADIDITERKQTEEALREAQASLEIAIMAARAGLWDWDLQTGETRYSDSWKTLFGYSAADLDGSLEEWATLVHPEDLNRLAGSTSATTAIADPPTPYAEEFRLRHKDGTYRWVLSRAKVLHDAAGTPQRMVGAHVDITDQQQTKLALQEAEASLQLAAESAKVAVWKCNLQTLTIHFSSGWKCVLGREENTLTLAALWNLVHPDDRAKTAETMQEYLQGRAAACEIEQRMLHADGSYRWVLSRGVVTHDTEDRPAHWFGADIDVTERKRIELALQEAQTSAQLAAESAKVAVWKSDLRTLTIRFSSGWKRVLGRDEGEIPLAALWDLVHPDDRARATAATQEQIQGRTGLYENEQRMLHADGSYRWVLTRSTIAYDIEGRPCGQYGADIDITERKELEEALRRSEEQYRHLVEDITDIIYTADREGRVTYMSPVIERLYGYAPVEVLNRPFSDFIFPEDLPGVIERFREAVSGNPQPHDHRIVTKAGDVRWVRNHTRTIMKDGQIVGLRGVMSDVTARKRAVDALCALTATLEQQVAERSRELVGVNERLQLITDNMLDLLSQMSLEGVFQYVSPAHERVLGYAPQQMVGTSVLDLLHPDDIAPVTAIMEAAIRNASSGQAEFRYQHADGHYVWLETVGRLLLDDRGIPVGAVLSGRDVTARKRAEDALRQLSVELEQRVLERTAQLDAANKELEAFSYSVSHDLRTPLRYMDGFSKILLEGYSAQLDDRGRRALNHIQAASARMGQLINDLLSLSRVSRQPLRRQRVDLSALARGVAADLQAANPGRTVDLVFADGIIAPGDPSLLRVVLENLLGNAWKYSTKRPQARIEFGAMSIAEYGRIADSRMQDHSATPGSFNPQSEIRNPQVVYFVRDNGAGFDPAFSDKLFAPFQRLHSEAEFEGTGIGLAIVARIVRRHGGDIWAEGAVEQGATFYFTLGDG